MDGGSKRGCATVSMAKELASFVPAFCAGSILYGTCAAGEAYVVFGSSFDFSKYVSNSKSALGGDMALKLRSYKAVAAAGHALPIHLPPPMAAPSVSQISQLRALRSNRSASGSHADRKTRNRCVEAVESCTPHWPGCVVDVQLDPS